MLPLNIRDLRASGTGIGGGASNLWSNLLSAYGDDDDISLIIDPGDEVIFDMPTGGCPSYGYVVVMGGGKVTVTRSFDTELKCKGLMVDSDSEWFAGSRAISGTAYTTNLFPMNRKHDHIYTGPRTDEANQIVPATVPSGSGGGTNATNPLNGVMSKSRALMAMANSRIFLAAETPTNLRWKLAATLNIGDTSFVSDRALDLKDGQTVIIGTTKYNSENPAHNLTNFDHILTNGYGVEKVIINGNHTGATTINFFRDPDIAGTGAQFRHFGQLQYVVGKTRSGSDLEDIAGTNLSLTDWGIQSGDFFGTTFNSQTVFGSRAINSFAGYAGGAGAGGTRGRVVDHRAPCILLDRAITISCPDDSDWRQYGYGGTTGGMGHGVDTIFQREGVALRRFGKAGILANYGFHDHLRSVQPYGTVGSGTDLGDVDPSRIFVNRCSGWEGTNRFITVHGTGGMEVLDNVCYDGDTHMYFEEDGFERRCKIGRNVGIQCNRMNHQVRKNCARYGLTPHYSGVIKDHDKLTTTANIASLSTYYSNIDVEFNNPALGGRGPAVFWHSNPDTELFDNWANAYYVGIWNNFQFGPFGWSKDAIYNAFRSPPVNHNNNEAGCGIFKSMTTNPHVDTENGRLVSGPGDTVLDPRQDGVYQYGQNTDNGYSPPDADREHFTNMNFWKSECGLYANEAHDPQYEGWHLYGSSGKGDSEDMIHHKRYMVFGNGTPHFRGCMGGPNTLDDPYPDSGRTERTAVTMFLSYGAGSLEHSNFFSPGRMMGIGTWNHNTPPGNDELVQYGGLMHFWDFYVYSRLPNQKSPAGLVLNTTISGHTPGCPGMFLPSSPLFSVSGSRFQAIYDPASTGLWSTRMNASVLQLPADGSWYEMNGGWWIPGDSQFELYNTSGSIYVTPTAITDTGNNMNGKIIDATYNYYGVQVQFVNGTTDKVLFTGAASAVSAITFTRMQNDFVTSVATRPVPRWDSSIPDPAWTNMRHCVIEDGEKVKISYPGSDITSFTSFSFVVLGMSSYRFNSFSGADFFVAHPLNNATAVTFARYRGDGNSDYNIPLVSGNSLANLISSTDMCYWKDSTNNLIYFHVVEATPAFNGNSYTIGISVNSMDGIAG